MKFDYTGTKKRAIRPNFSKNQIRLKDSNNKNGALTWLTTLPLKNDEYFLAKQVFWDLICICYV